MKITISYYGSYLQNIRNGGDQPVPEASGVALLRRPDVGGRGAGLVENHGGLQSLPAVLGDRKFTFSPLTTEIQHSAGHN